MARRRRIAKPTPALAVRLLALALVTGASGCVKAYQPMSGLHHPVVVDPRAPNLTGLDLTVHCVPGKFVSRYESALLCRRVGQLFENQGAVVKTVASAGLPEDSFDERRPDDGEPEPGPRTDLSVELRARKVHESHHPLSWVACVFTFTLWPGENESTFAQDIEIRDGDGFLLVEETVQGRIVEQFGAGTWAANAVLDLVAREPDDRLTRANTEQHLSDDLYGQLSQMIFNAKIQHQLLREATAGVPQ